MLLCVCFHDVKVFIVTASLPGARSTHGVRAGVYKLGEKCFAFKAAGQQYIWYDGDDQTLRIRLLFKKDEHAWKFQSDLLSWNQLYAFCRLEEDPDVDSDVNEITAPTQISRIFLRDYRADVYDDSPCQSLDQYHGSRSSVPSTVEGVEPQSDLALYQSIEAPSLFRATKPYQLHLIDNAECKKRKKHLMTSDDNMLAGSWDMHQVFDGLNATAGHMVATLVIEPVGVGDIKPDINRRRVTVRVRFLTTETEELMKPRLREGYRDIGEKCVELDLFVSDHATFTECLRWKAKKTMDKWEEYQAVLASI